MPPTSPRATDAAPDLRLLFSELVRLETELWNAVEGRVKSDYGVTLPVFEFLQVISRTPDCRVQDIAAELGITVGGTSKIVDRIEAAAYCARSANPGDRRSSIIKLTPSGKKLLVKLTAVVDDELRSRLDAGLTDKAITQLTKTLTRLRTAARTDGAAQKTA